MLVCARGYTHRNYKLHLRGIKGKIGKHQFWGQIQVQGVITHSRPPNKKAALGTFSYFLYRTVARKLIGGVYSYIQVLPD